MFNYTLILADLRSHSVNKQHFSQGIR